MSKLAAAFAEANDTGLVYSVADDGRIRPLTLAAYEALPDSSVLLRRVRLTRSAAVSESNRIRGLQDAQTIWRN